MKSTTAPSPDLSKEKTLYVIGYAHLDTQWRWNYAYTIVECIKNTLNDNIALLEKYPDYRFNFTGAIRYEMMRDFFPEQFERIKEYVRQGRWYVSGSSVDEGDVNVPSPESIIRQVLYGNRWFQRELGATSSDYMLPDCFGFPASFPSVLAHCGIKGFSTQKLVWGRPGGPPFNFGVWTGPDGKEILAALNPGGYSDGFDKIGVAAPEWVQRVNDNGEKYGVYADFRYYGVGDIGGAPREADVKLLMEALRNPESPVNIAVAASQQIFEDVTPEQATNLPRYAGDLLLREHSTGCLTSQAYMKRWNRKNENLADSAERAASLADWLGALPYPSARLEAAWFRVLGSQFHDILPGTSLPSAYEFSWNDEIIALNQFAGVLTSSVAAIVQAMDTRVGGQALVVYNPLAIERSDLVEISLPEPGANARWQVVGPDGVERAAQPIRHEDGSSKLLFVARVPANGFTVFDVRPAAPSAQPAGARADSRTLENDHYRVTLNDAGDIASIVDKAHGNRELLAAPARLEFRYERPREWPAWNMDWADRDRPPMAFVDGPATIRTLEEGPVRATIEVTRKAQGSIFVQRISLTSGVDRVEVCNTIDWQSQQCSLKAAFPLTVSNPGASYNMGLGVITRANNDPDKFEVPSHEWVDLTDSTGDYGVTILEDSKYGSDKPADNILRLTLLYTPGIHEAFLDQCTQDWGRHDIVYAIHGHAGTWQQAEVFLQGRRLNQPLVAFSTPSHPGPLGKAFGMASLNTTQVDIRAIKKAEDGQSIIVRVQELTGRPAKGVSLSLLAPILAAIEMDGQERPLYKAKTDTGRLIFDLGAFEPKTFGLVLNQSALNLAPPTTHSVDLKFDTDVVSHNANRRDGNMANGWTYPAEQFPKSLTVDGVSFTLGNTDDGARNALACRGQQIPLPAHKANRLYLLAAATEDTVGEFMVNGEAHRLNVPAWTGFIGQWDARKWKGPFADIDFGGYRGVDHMETGYIKRTPLAWFSTQCHSPEKDEAYRFSYLFLLAIPLEVGRGVPAAPSFLTLPDNPKIRILAASLAETACASLLPVQPLYDDFTGRAPMLPLLHLNLPLPKAAVPFVRTPNGNGTIDWSKAALIPLDRSTEGVKAVAMKAELLALHDGESLHLQLTERSPLHYAEDDGFAKDRWELFFARDRKEPYRQIGLFPKGGIAHCSRGETVNVGAWSGSVQGRTLSINDNEWIWQLEIPLKQLVPDGAKPGDTLCANFLRGARRHHEDLAWSPLYSQNFHNPGRFGELTLSK